MTGVTGVSGVTRVPGEINYKNEWQFQNYLILKSSLEEVTSSRIGEINYKSK